MSASEGDWVAVREAIRSRMRELNISTAALAREAGLSETTVRYLVHSITGHNRTTLVALAAVLRWRHDYLINISNGKPDKNVRVMQVEPSEIADLKRTVEETNSMVRVLLGERK
jgi:DNA-binding CsgD family transcriptional regulator